MRLPDCCLPKLAWLPSFLLPALTPAFTWLLGLLGCSSVNSLSAVASSLQQPPWWGNPWDHNLVTVCSHVNRDQSTSKNGPLVKNNCGLDHALQMSPCHLPGDTMTDFNCCLHSCYKLLIFPCVVKLLSLWKEVKINLFKGLWWQILGLCQRHQFDTSFESMWDHSDSIDLHLLQACRNTKAN